MGGFTSEGELPLFLFLYVQLSGFNFPCNQFMSYLFNLYVLCCILISSFFQDFTQGFDHTFPPPAAPAPTPLSLPTHLVFPTPPHLGQFLLSKYSSMCTLSFEHELIRSTVLEKLTLPLSAASSCNSSSARRRTSGILFGLVSGQCHS